MVLKIVSVVLWGIACAFAYIAGRLDTRTRVCMARIAALDVVADIAKEKNDNAFHEGALCAFKAMQAAEEENHV